MAKKPTMAQAFKAAQKSSGSKSAKQKDPSDYGSSAADFRRKEEEDKRIARETKRNPKDASGSSYFGETQEDKPRGPRMPKGTPAHPGRKPEPSNKKPNPKPKPSPKPRPSTPSTTTTTVPSGLAQSKKKK
jgi:hypothetical protein